MRDGGQSLELDGHMLRRNWWLPAIAAAAFVVSGALVHDSPVLISTAWLGFWTATLSLAPTTRAALVAVAEAETDAEVEEALAIIPDATLSTKIR